MKKDELYHHGIKGMRWGLRRYQNEDGSLTAAGEKRYYGKANAIQKDIDSFKPIRGGLKTKKGKQLLTEGDVSGMVRGLETQRNAARAKGDARRERDRQKLERREQIKNSDALKKFAKGAAITAGVALAAYGGYKVAKMHPDAINKAKSAVSSILSKSKQSKVNRIVSPNSNSGKSTADVIKSTTSRMNFKADTGRKERTMSAKEFRDFDKKMRSDEPFKIGSQNSGKNSDIKTIKNNVNKAAVKADKSVGKAQSNLKKLQESNAKSKKELDRMSSIMDEFEKRMNSNESFNLDDFGSYLMNNKKKRS